MAGGSGRTRTLRSDPGASTTSGSGAFAGAGEAGGAGGSGAGGNGRVRRADRSEPEGRAEVVDLVEALPREAAVVGGTTEVPVGGRTLVDRAPEVEVAQDGRGTEVEHLRHGIDDA